MSIRAIQIIYITTDDVIAMGQLFEPKLIGVVCLKCKPGPGGSLDPCDLHRLTALAILAWAEVEAEKMGDEVEQV